MPRYSRHSPPPQCQVNSTTKLHGISMHYNRLLLSCWRPLRRAGYIGRPYQKPLCRIELLDTTFQIHCFQSLRLAHTQDMSSKPRPKRVVQEPRPSARYASLTESRVIAERALQHPSYLPCQRNPPLASRPNIELLPICTRISRRKPVIVSGWRDSLCS